MAREQKDRSATVLFTGGQLTPGSVAFACERLRALIEREDAGPAVADLRRLSRVDLATIDALARLQLTAHRLGGRVVLRNAGPEVLALLDLAGLRELFAPALAVKLEGQAEEREQAGGVQEEADTGDPPA